MVLAADHSEVLRVVAVSADFWMRPLLIAYLSS
jgi:hypothetical protein